MTSRLPYADLASEYVEDILTFGVPHVVDRMGERWGVANEGVRSRTRRAMERGEFPPHITYPTYLVDQVYADMQQRWRRHPIGQVMSGVTPLTRIYFSAESVTQEELTATGDYPFYKLWPLEVARTLNSESSEGVNEVSGAG